MDQQKPLQEKFKKVQRKAVLKLVALLLVVATLIATATWAWFTEPDQQATAEGLTMLLETQESLKMSVNGSEYTSNFNLSDSDLIENLDMVPLTGLGYKLESEEIFLYEPSIKFNNANGQPIIVTTVDWTEGTANVDYIALEITFATEFPAYIYLGEGTEVITECENLGLPLSGENAGNISRNGDFSRDAIVGALRMSVSEPDQEDQLRFIWIPRPDVLLSQSSESDEYVLSTGVSASNSKSRTHEFYNLSKVEATYLGSCLTSSAAFVAQENNVNSANALTQIGETDQDVTCTVYIKIWIEGRDTEAVRALSRGKFQINLNFVAIEKTTTS